MSKRQAWVVEFKRRKAWAIQILGHDRKSTMVYLRDFRACNPGLETRIVKYVPEKP